LLARTPTTELVDAWRRKAFLLEAAPVWERGALVVADHDLSLLDQKPYPLATWVRRVCAGTGGVEDGH
jgi:hypothetical protein